MTVRRRDLLYPSGALVAGALLTGCVGETASADGSGPASTPTDNGPGATSPGVASDAQRETDPDAGELARRTAIRGNTAFAFSLLEALVDRSPKENLLVSPYSISIALAMTWAGARGETETRMADAMRYELAQERLHPAFNALALELAAHGNEETDGEDTDTESGDSDTEDEGTPFRLDVVNAIWGLAEYPYRNSYLDTLATHYGAGLRTVDFATRPERVRARINDWVEARTNGKIEDLLPKDVITTATRLVLTNAVYFRANWEHTFSENLTGDGEFTALDGSSSTVPMMTQSETFPYAEIDGHQLIELPYVGGDVGMLVILPAAGEFETVERSLTPDRLGGFIDALEPREGEISLPRFAYDSNVSLKEALSGLGMSIAFDSGKANFDGMVDLGESGENLYVRDVIHTSHVAVDEQGTEAAAATGVVVAASSASANEFEMTVDRPFLFAIRDRGTGTVLFLGRVVDAGAAQ
jgi:serpin B